MDEDMQAAFLKQARKLCNIVGEDKQMLPRIGLEVEAAVVNRGRPAEGTDFMSLDFTSPELGKTQLEYRTDPIVLHRIADLEDALDERESVLRERSGRSQIVRIGAIPNLSVETLQVSDKMSYRVVPVFHDEQRGDHINTVVSNVNFDRAKCMGLFNATQFNIQADSMQDAVDKMNRSLMLSPYLVALSGNARIVEGKDTGIDDIRMLAWEASHDIRTKEQMLNGAEKRMGTPNTYFKNIEDFYTRASQFPFIMDNLDAAFPIGIGLYWLDARVKVFKNKPVVEYRAMSTQPTAKEDVAMAAFYIGRLTYSQAVHEPLMSLPMVQMNREAAMRDGLRGKLFAEGKVLEAPVALARELRKAEQGLRMHGYGEQEIADYTGILWGRIADKATPAHKFAEKVRMGPVEELLMHYVL